MFVWGKPRGENFLDTGHHFYETYKTKGEIAFQLYSINCNILENPIEIIQRFKGFLHFAIIFFVL